MTYKKQESDDAVSHFNLIRGLDCILWSLTSFYILLLFQWQDFFIASFPFVVCLPLFSLAYGSFQLPVKLWQSPLNEVSSMQSWSLLAALTFPFVLFMQESFTFYFILCAFVSLVSCVKVLLVLMKICLRISEGYKDAVLLSEAKWARRFIYFAVVLVSVSACLYFVYLDELRGLIRGYGLGLLMRLGVLFLVFPLLFPVTLLFRLKLLVIRKYKEKLQGC